MVWIFISFLTDKDPISEFNNFQEGQTCLPEVQVQFSTGSISFYTLRPYQRYHKGPFFHHQIEDELPNCGVKTNSDERIPSNPEDLQYR